MVTLAELHDHIFLLYFFIPIYVYSLVFVLHIITLSMEWPDLHFTAGFILYNCVCDKSNLES